MDLTAPQLPACNKHRLFLSGLGLLLAAGLIPLSGATRLTLSESSGAVGTTRQVPLAIETDGSVAAIQLDVKWDRSRVTIGELLPGDALSSDGLIDSDTVFFDRRAVLFSPSNAPMGTGTLLTIPVTFQRTVPEQEAVLSLNSVIMAAPDGSNITAQLMPYGRLLTHASGSEVTYTTADYRSGVPPIEAVAFDTDGGLVTVSFLSDGNVFEVQSFGPYAAAFAPSEEGGYLISVVANDADGNTTDIGSFTFNTELQNAFAEWIAVHSPADTDPMADPKKSGLPNLLRFALGLGTTESGGGALPRLETAESPLGADFPSLVFTKPRDAEGIRYRVEISDSLSPTSTWNSGEGFTQPLEIIEDGVVQTVRVKSVTPVASASTQFMRLVVEVDPAP